MIFYFHSRIYSHINQDHFVGRIATICKGELTITRCGYYYCYAKEQHVLKGNTVAATDCENVLATLYTDKTLLPACCCVL